MNILATILFITLTLFPIIPFVIKVDDLVRILEAHMIVVQNVRQPCPKSLHKTSPLFVSYIILFPQFVQSIYWIGKFPNEVIILQKKQLWY